MLAQMPCVPPAGRPMNRLEVCITVDTEFDINGSLRYPDMREPIGAASIRRDCAGRSHGLGMILDTLEQYGQRGTFFIEAMNVHYFGDGPMGCIADEIQARGHDLQLHIHPCWRALPGRKAGTVPDAGYTDALTDYRGDELVALLQEGREIFARLTGRAPLAFRSGGLLANRELFSALAATGFRLSSTLAIGVFAPAEPELRVASGRCRISGVTEVPVLSYRSPGVTGRSRDRSATLIGTGWRELKGLLDQAARDAAGPFAILTHSSEFSRDAGTPLARTYVPAPRVAGRLDRLCRYLSEHADRFRAVTFSQQYDEWTSAPLPETAPPTLRSGLSGLAIRIVENDVLPRLGVF